MQSPETMQKILWISIFFALFSSNAIADSLNDQEISYIQDKVESSPASRVACNDKFRCGSTLVKQFYSANNFQPVWTKDGSVLPNADQLLDILSHSYQDGLNPESYHIEQINAMREDLKTITNQDDQAEALANLDATLTDSFFLYSSNLAFGAVNSKTTYPNWIITKRQINLIDTLNKALKSDDLSATLNELSPQDSNYNKLKIELAKYQGYAAKMKNWPTVAYGPKLKRGMHDPRVTSLQKRLLVTGELSNNSGKKGIFDKNLEQAVIKYQKNNGLTADGVVGKTTVDALDVPLLTRIKQIELNMDRLRWLPADLGSSYIMVNIPDYSLSVVQDGKAVMDMPVIVGKDEGLQSCVLSSQITYLDINPYWYIPTSIANKDLIPKLKRNPNYLAENDMKMFTAYGSNGSEVDPKKIKWSKVESGTFSYKFRQEPGEKNPLGRIKFIFQNKCGIYLHDTSSPELFKKHTRDFSHGCIRIGKPIELATYLLSDKPNWTESQILATIDSGNSKAINLTQPMNIHIVYETAWVNEDNQLQFRNDIYSIDSIPFPVWLPNEHGVETKPLPTKAKAGSSSPVVPAN